MDLTGQTAIVTGAGSGIGRGIANVFAAAGAKVAAVDVNVEGARETARLIRQAKGAAVSRSRQSDALVKRVVAWAGRLDVLVNNTAVDRHCSVLDMDEREWDRVLDVNLKGPFLCAQAAARYWIEKGIAGRVVNVTSVSAERGVENNAHYIASKAGLRGLTQALALDLAPHGIRVNTVGPSGIPTNILGRDWSDPAAAVAIAQRMPIKCMGTAEEIGQAALFLCSAESSFITGASIYADGGRLAHL